MLPSFIFQIRQKNPPPVVHPLKQGTGGGRGVQQQQHQPTHEDTHRSVDGGTMGPHGPPDKPKGGPGALLSEKTPGPVKGTGGHQSRGTDTPDPWLIPGTTRERFKASPRLRHQIRPWVRGKYPNRKPPYIWRPVRSHWLTS